MGITHIVDANQPDSLTALQSSEAFRVYMQSKYLTLQDEEQSIVKKIIYDLLQNASTLEKVRIILIDYYDLGLKGLDYTLTIESDIHYILNELKYDSNPTNFQTPSPKKRGDRKQLTPRKRRCHDKDNDSSLNVHRSLF